jgi:hypothetical protein
MTYIDVRDRPSDQYFDDEKIEVGNGIKDDWRVSIPDNVLFQQLGDVEGEVVLLDVQNGGYFGLNEVGASIWRLIQEVGVVGDIFGALRNKYDVSEKCLWNDLERFLTDLHAQGLVELKGKNTG